jgi:hypothetical protein
MLSAAITALFTAAAVLAIAVIAQTLREAVTAWERLMREGEVLRAGIALQVAWAGEMRLRPSPAQRSFAMRRPVSLQPLPLRACAAA